jgi:hypothetical protein
MEETKCLKPSGKASHDLVAGECAGRNASERRASLEKDDARADPAANPGKADTTGWMSKAGALRPCPDLPMLNGRRGPESSLSRVDVGTGVDTAVRCHRDRLSSMYRLPLSIFQSVQPRLR